MKTIIIFFITTLMSTITIAQNKILVLGDSLSEGYGVAQENSYPAILQKKISATGKSWTVVNSSVSGATSAQAMSILKWQLKSQPQIMILALGANDALRGLSVDGTKKNLQEAIELAQKQNIKVVLAGMMAPPNYGKEYGQKFKKVFSDLAKKYKLRLIPFILDKVAGDSKLNQVDGIHPNEKGHAIIADTVYNSIKDLL